MTAYSVEPPNWFFAAMGLSLLATCLVGFAVLARRLTNRRRGTILLATLLNSAPEWTHDFPAHPIPHMSTSCVGGWLAPVEVHRR